MGFLHHYMNQTCPEQIDQYIRNLTSSYTDKRNEPTMVSASLLMFILAGLFFNLNLFRGISDISAILNPGVRRFLTLFLPVMSYLFSEAKNAVPRQWTGSTAASGGDLSMKAGLILAWMLLVELVRKKVDEIHMRGYSGTIMSAGRVVWLGSLVFFNIKSAGRKALFSILWILCATRVVQRIAFTEISKRSYEHGKNARLISSCMAKIMLEKQEEHTSRGGDVKKQPVCEPSWWRCCCPSSKPHAEADQGQGHLNKDEHMAKIMPKKPEEHPSEVIDTAPGGDVEKQPVGEPSWLKCCCPGSKPHAEANQGQCHLHKSKLLLSCKYVVMGEAKLVNEATADGYELADTDNDSVLRVCTVWKLAKTDGLINFRPSKQSKCLKRLCFSFALFKLLRRRFEHVPAITADDEASHCRDLIFKDGGLLVGLKADEEARSSQDQPHDGAYGCESAAEALFQVVHDEVNFLIGYYHSVVPVALASPSFLVVNYFFVLVVVALLCLMAVILCGNGDAGYAFRSIGNDNFVLRFGIAKLTACVFSKAIQTPSAFFSALDLAITALLFAIYFYEEIWEFFVFLFSDWFMVSLLASYAGSKKQAPFRQSSFRFAVRCLIRLRGTLSQPRLRFRQFSALNLPWPHKLPLVPSLTTSVELVPEDVKKSIIDYLANDTPLSNGRNALQSFPTLSWACGSSSVAEVILTWHIATSIFEAEQKPQPDETEAVVTSRRVAISLSKYCAYLVAFHPELLPDNPEKAEAVVDSMKAELRDILGCRGCYYLSPLSKRVDKMRKSSDGVVSKGKRLATELKTCSRDKGVELAWEVLANVWTELVVFVAPSSDEQCVKAHKEMLVQGVEFITVLWALTTHTGVSRPAN
ncbi:hypothetical protein EJB05_49733, partial [Eragrostis curvula]